MINIGKAMKILLRYRILISALLMCLLIAVNFPALGSFQDEEKIRALFFISWSFFGLLFLLLWQVGNRYSLRLLLLLPYLTVLLIVFGFLLYVGIFLDFGHDIKWQEKYNIVWQEIQNGTEPSYLAYGIFPLIPLLIIAVLGILKHARWGYIAVVISNIIIGGSILVRHYTIAFCGTSNCVEAEEASHLTHFSLSFLLLVSVFSIYYFFRTTKDGRISAQLTTRIALLLLACILVLSAPPTIRAYKQERDFSRQGQELIALARARLDPLYPTFLPRGWELRWEIYAFEDELQSNYFPPDYRGNWSVSLEIRQIPLSSPTLKTNKLEELAPDIGVKEREDITIHKSPAIYVRSIDSNNYHYQHLLWLENNLRIELSCTGDCPLQKEQLIAIADSMKPYSEVRQ